MILPDYNDLYDEYDRRQARELEKLPKCEYCGEPIQDDYCYDIQEGVICEDCLIHHFRKRTEDYIE